MTNADKKELIAELLGNKCQCGKRKSNGHSFCRSCFFRLPQPQQTALYRRVGEGYEAAYAGAIRTLMKKAK